MYPSNAFPYVYMRNSQCRTNVNSIVEYSFKDLHEFSFKPDATQQITKLNKQKTVYNDFCELNVSSRLDYLSVSS